MATRDRLAAALGVDAAALHFATDLGQAVGPAVHARIAASGRRRVVLAATEGAVMREAVALLSDVAEIIEAPVRPEGRIDLDRLSEMMGTPTAAVVVAAADPRTGVVAPLAEVIGLARAHGAMVVTDATQLPGRSPCDLPTLGADLVLFGQRGPAGTAGPVAVIAAGQDSLPDSSGVAGEPPADAVQALTDGLVAAIETEAPEAWRLAALRDRFETTVIARIPGVETLGASVPRLPNTTLLRFIGVDSDTLAKLMPALVGYGVGEGLGSERAGARRLNYVLQALGLREDQAQGCVTFSLHPGTSEGDVDVAVGALVEAVPLARSVTLGGDHGE
jgi:cysteine desulfurase